MVVVSGDVVQANPEFAPSRWVYAVAGILGVACVEEAMVPLWNLLTLVDRLDVFSGRAVRWVDAIIACAAVEAALMLFVTLYGGLAHAEYRDPASGAYVDVALGAPGVVLLGAVGLLLLAAFVLLMLVMRSLLAAIAQRDELEAVIWHGDPSEPRRDARQTQNVGGGADGTRRHHAGECLGAEERAGQGHTLLHA